MYHEGSAFTAVGALGTVCAAIGSLLVTAVVLHGVGAPPMLIAAIGQLVMAATPLLVLRFAPRDRPWDARGAVRMLGLRPAAPRYFVAAALIGASAWYLNLRLVAALPIPHEDAALTALVERPALPVVLLAVALAPALGEELLFRGVLVRAFATRFSALGAVALAALVFALYHLRVVQLVPTFTLGLVLGALALRAGSALPGMLLHGINNALALLIARDELPALAAALTASPPLALAGCALASSLGIAMIARRPRV